VKHLLSYVAIVDSKDWYGLTPLFAAVRNGKEIDVACLLAVQGAYVQFEDGFGYNSL
jgi:ankyrin repeat protein